MRNELTNDFDESVVNGNPINEKDMKIIITRTKDDNIINLGEYEDKLMIIIIYQEKNLYIY